MTARREDDQPEQIAELLADAEMTRRLDGLARLARAPVETPLSARVIAALVACLGADSKTVQRLAVDALATAAGARARPRHGERIDGDDVRDTSDDRRERRADSGDNVVAAVRGALASADARLRWGAAYALGTLTAESFGSERADLDAMPALLEALGDADGDVRWAAAELLVRLGRTSNSAAVRAALIERGDRGDPVARKMALYCLRDLEVRGGDLLALVERAARADDAHLRLAALSVLSHLRDTADAPDAAAAIALRCLEADAHLGVRRAAAIVLGHLQSRTPRVLAALGKAASDASDQGLARAATAALKRMETP